MLRPSFDLPGSYCIFVYFVFFTSVGGLEALVWSVLFGRLCLVGLVLSGRLRLVGMVW